MSLNNLSSQLRRDLVANPKKAAVLGLMVVVALYFWGPLAWKFLKASGAKQNNKANMASLILTDDPIESSQQTKSGSRIRFKWERVRQLIQQDPHMLSATFDASWVDPFGKPAASAAEAEATRESSGADPSATEATASGTTDPQGLGLVLGGIMVSPRGRIATINGEACRQGEIVVVIDSRNKNATCEIRILKINRQSVQLEFGGRIFSLELAQPRLANGDDFERGNSKERKQ